MTDKPEIPRVKANGRQPPESMAFQLWIEAKKPSIRGFARHLNKLGYTIDFSTLSRWKDKNPQWLVEYKACQHPMDPIKIIDALKAAADDATELTPEHFVGVKAQLVARLYESIKTMPIDSVDEWLKALDACDRIESLIHAERGKAIAGMDTIAIPRGAKPSLINRLEPAVTLPTFKKAGTT